MARLTGPVGRLGFGEATLKPSRAKLRDGETLAYSQNCRSVEDPMWKAYLATKPGTPAAFAAMETIQRQRQRELIKDSE